MFHCPYCGTIVKDDESYCIKCGDELPHDVALRFKGKKKFNRYWYFPISTIIICLLALTTFYIVLDYRDTKAKEFYEQGENHILEENYLKARESFTDALSFKHNFYEADIGLSFAVKVIDIESDLKEAIKLQEKLQYQDALDIVNTAENDLKHYHGSAVTTLINEIVSHRSSIEMDQMQSVLDDQPSIDKLKSLLWESEAIQDDNSETITADIRSQIVDYTFSKASEQLNNKQFSDALFLVDDGLKYAANAEKLLSLKTTIEKEKTAFEMEQQQRIEQAINLAAEEQEKNEEDAVQIENVDIAQDDKENWIVNGEVTSVATIPINSVLIEYSLHSDEDNEILTNKVFVFPDKLYSNETGKFEFTHYDIDKKHENVEIKVNKITWYTD